MLDCTVNRVVDGLPASIYHSGPEMSSTQLSAFARSPLHFRSGANSIDPDTSRIGTAFHDLMLEGGRGLIEVPGWRRDKRGDAIANWRAFFAEMQWDLDILELPAPSWWAEVGARHGVLVTTPAERAQLHGMKESLALDGRFEHVVNGEGVAERSLFGTIESVPFRVRLDWLFERDGTFAISDLKSANDASQRGFVGSCMRYRYYVQAILYANMLMALTDVMPHFQFIVVEKHPPYACAPYELDFKSIERSIEVARLDLLRYRRCVEEDRWPSYPGNELLSLPLEDPYDGVDPKTGEPIADWEVATSFVQPEEFEAA